MRALRPALPRIAAALVASAAAAGVLAPATQAHGGETLVDGASGGVTVVVQRTEAEPTSGGGQAVDISTILGGPGTGTASVDYWIRPQGGRTFKVETRRDAGGTFHRDIPTAGRGDASAWDLSAIVTLSSGRKLRVSTDPDNAPGPDPRQAAEEAQTDQDDAPTSPTLTEGNDPADATPAPTSPAAGDTAAGDDASDAGAVDISGEQDGPPAWAFPSFLVLTMVGFAILAVRRRNLARKD